MICIIWLVNMMTTVFRKQTTVIKLCLYIYVCVCVCNIFKKSVISVMLKGKFGGRVISIVKDGGHINV